MATTSTTTISPMQFPEAAMTGYNLGSEYYKQLLQNPNLAYPGARVAPLSQTQKNIFSYAGGASPVSPVTAPAQDMLTSTVQGDYLNGPQAQAAVQSLAAPIFQEFNSSVMPGIRDRAQMTGQGLTGSRRGIAEGNAINTLGRAISDKAIAPIFMSERANMMNAPKAAAELSIGDSALMQALLSIGQAQQTQGQNEVNAEQTKYWEPTKLWSQAAQALMGIQGLGSPGGQTTTSSETPGVLGGINAGINTIGSAANAASNLYSLYKLFA